ncbi:MAG TPA: VOC family protein [Steroidobacteraceae bacterium]|jgi:predicted enzyme related to lactoylglutathione lyase|nr:VOC family protein [Steroidobacteraceae bacterium]
MANPPSSFIWYELLTTDSNAAAKFYGAVVGWKIADRPDPMEDGRDYRTIGRSDGGSAGGLFQLTADMLKHGAKPTWLGYLHVNDVEAAVAAIETDGGKKLMKMDLPVGQIAMVTDPMGTPFYVMSPIPPPGKPDAVSDVFDPKAEQRVRWNELQSPDLARAKAFYAKHFGFEFNEIMPMGAMGDYCFVDQGGLRLGAIMQKPEQSPIASWLFYFGVPSAAAAKRAIEAGGGKITNGPHQVPGGDWIVTATDPQGAPFGVVSSQG